jgi:hypothetical protein
MKISDYCQSGDSVIHPGNVFRTEIFSKLCSNIPTFPMSGEVLEWENVETNLAAYKNTVLTLFSIDIDFPPPKWPYKYDYYFDKTILPEGYENIEYDKKIQTSLLTIIEENNIKLFTHACSVLHPSIVNMPIGVYPRFNHSQWKSNPKTVLCYANFGIHCDRWFGNPRKQVLNAIRNKPFIAQENIQEKNRNMNNDYFYHVLSRSKFAVCPRGCGIDTYRLWDCIVLGCIPIVERYPSHEQWYDLPILFIDSIQEYETMTEEFLHQKYAEMMDRDFAYEKVTMNYWLDRINTSYVEHNLAN